MREIFVPPNVAPCGGHIPLNRILAENARLQPNYRETSGKHKMSAILLKNKTEKNSEG